MAEQIKPCPWSKCGSSDVGVFYGSAGVHVECNNCCARGPIVEGEENAIAAWNAAPRAPQEQAKLEPYYKLTPLELARIVEYTLESFTENLERDGNQLDAGTQTIADVRRFVHEAQYRQPAETTGAPEQPQLTPACLTCARWMPETPSDASARCQLLNVNVMDTFWCKLYDANKEEDEA